MAGGTETATLGGGCFWCLDVAYRQIEGVTNVVSGYAGGRQPDPTYREVCSGTTGHAEVVQVEFDPGVISHREIVDILWSLHDPTTPNRQGADRGTQPDRDQSQAPQAARASWGTDEAHRVAVRRGRQPGVPGAQRAAGMPARPAGWSSFLLYDTPGSRPPRPPTCRTLLGIRASITGGGR